MKKKIPIGTSNYRELRIQDYYTVDTRCAQKQKFDDKGFSRTGNKGNTDHSSTSLWQDLEYE